MSRIEQHIEGVGAARREGPDTEWSRPLALLRPGPVRRGSVLKALCRPTAGVSVTAGGLTLATDGNRRATDG